MWMCAAKLIFISACPAHGARVCDIDQRVCVARAVLERAQAVTLIRHCKLRLGCKKETNLYTLTKIRFIVIAPNVIMDDYGGFKTQFTSVMENALKTAVAETTKLFERTLQQLKAELVHLRQENADLKTGTFDREYLTSHAEDGSPRPDHAQSVSKCDTGVQCEKPVMVEKCCSPAPFDERSLRLQDITSDRLVDMCSSASEDGNRQLALLLIKKEPQETECDEYAPGYFLLKQEGAEPILVRKEPLKDTMERVLIPTKFQSLHRCNGSSREISTTNIAEKETTASNDRVDCLNKVPQTMNISRLRESLASQNDTKRQKAFRPVKSTLPDLSAHAVQQAPSVVILSAPKYPLSKKLGQTSTPREEEEQTGTLDHPAPEQAPDPPAQLITLQTQQIDQNIQNPNIMTHLGPHILLQHMKPITDPCQSVQSIQALVATTEKAVSPPLADPEMTPLGPQSQNPFSPDHHTRLAPGLLPIPLSQITSLSNQVTIPHAQGPVLPLHVPVPPAHAPVPPTQMKVQSNDLLTPQSLDNPGHFPLVSSHNPAPLSQPTYTPNHVPFPPPFIPTQSVRSSVPPVLIPQTNAPCPLEHRPVTSHYQILPDSLCSPPDHFFNPPDNASDLLQSLNPPFHSPIVLTPQEAALEQPSMMHSQSTGQPLQLAPLLTLKEQQAAASNQGNVSKRGPTLPMEIPVSSVNNFEQNIQRFPLCSSPAINSEDTDSAIMEMHSEEEPTDSEDSHPALLPGVTEHYKVLSKPGSNFSVLDPTIDEQIFTINKDPQIDNDVTGQKEGCDISIQDWEPTDSSGELSHSALSVPAQSRGHIFQKASRKLLEKKTECSECGRILSNASSLENHMRLHRGERPYTCSQCGKAFPSVRGLNRHVKVHAEEKGYKCEECGRSFVYQFTLTKHKLIHSGDRPFPCKICGKKFLAKADRATHMRMHTGEKPFFCIQCGKSFKHRVALNMHMQGHRGEKRYVCPHCDKGFVDLGNFKRHKRIHTGEKPFECKECGKRFTQSAHLKKHVNTQHIVQRTK
ncbi:uncharacterized protein LOC143476409 isoform X2 [Brachyhypopomus gauderio]|uniref:uncharacterized protein LOC143476409 isoform X2 n=1 Tax=Brachyhypopomus gauderio TaxID=698409 RepID=UPI0040413129